MQHFRPAAWIIGELPCSRWSLYIDLGLLLGSLQALGPFTPPPKKKNSRAIASNPEMDVGPNFFDPTQPGPQFK